MVVYDYVFGIGFFYCRNGLVLEHTGIDVVFQRLDTLAKFGDNLLFLKEALHAFPTLKVACIYDVCLLRVLR